ncbi:MAG: hypothetical protein Q9188_002567 [Gyalolechia gomerana]
MAFHREGAFIKAFHEMVPHILRNKSYSLSTFEKCADVLNPPHDSQEPITKLGASEFDVQIWFAIAAELEAEGEAIASKVFARSADSWNEEDLCNLKIVLVDSLIGRKKYGRAEEVLLTALQSGRMPSYIRNIANLRLNKIKRQLSTLTTLESFTGLTEIETDVLDPSTANAIRYEYLEELSATLSCSDVLQALATFKSSVKAIQKLLNHPNARKDHILLTKIAVYVKGTIRGSFCEEVDQTTERITQSDSTDSPHGFRPVARQPLNEWNREIVIAFDSGCVRSYGSLLILEALMKKIKDEEKRLDTLELNTGITASSLAPFHNRPTVSNIESPTLDVANAGLPNLSGVERRADSTPYLPCHYFDFVAGNSTGGLIAIMLSRLRMTVDDCITEYKTLCRKVFDTRRPFSPGFAPWASYNYNVLETVIEEIIARNDQYTEGIMPGFPSDGDLCKTLVLVSKEIGESRVPYLFRTFSEFQPKTYVRKELRHLLKNGHGLPHLWQVARATFTIPTYFPPIKIRLYTDDRSENELWFNDGSGVWDNPSLEIYQDIVTGCGASSKRVGLFISIGAGSFPGESSSFVLGSSSTVHSNQIARKATHRAMLHLSNRDQFPYYRFDGGELLSQIPNPKKHGFDRRFMTYEKTGKAVAAYLHRNDVQDNLDECAELLVRRRRLRTRDPSAWDRYAWASFYECSYQGCPFQKTRFNTAELYKNHVMRVHSTVLAGKPLEQAMKESRRSWQYPSRST